MAALTLRRVPVLDDRGEVLQGAATVERLRTAYVDEETAIRGYLAAARDRTFLEPFAAGQRAMIEATASLRQSFDADQDVLRLLDAVTDAGRQWTDTVARPVLDAPDNSADPVEADTAKASFDQVRSSLEALATRIDQLAANTIENSNSARHVAIAAGVVSLVLYGALIVLSGVLVRAWFVRPVRHLESLVDANSPDLVGAVRGPSEIVAAARAVSDLRHALVVDRDSARRQSEALEQTATLAVQVAVELGGATGECPAGWTVAASLEPAEGLVAGDSYGVVLTSPDVIAVVVIDIAGHGAQPALEALRCKDLLKAVLRSGQQPGEALGWLDNHDALAPGQFLTAIVALVDTRTGVVRYANAGHPPPLLATAGSVVELAPTGPLLGVFPATWQTRTVTMDKHSVLAVYTDGLPEARNLDRSFYGEERVASLLAEMITDDAESILKTILDDPGAATGFRRADDVTLVVVSRQDPT